MGVLIMLKARRICEMGALDFDCGEVYSGFGGVERRSYKEGANREKGTLKWGRGEI